MVSYLFLIPESDAGEEVSGRIGVISGIAKAVACPGADTESEYADDLNVNGRVSIVDAQIAYNLACGKYTVSDVMSNTEIDMLRWLMADVNRDEVVDASDARAVQVFVHSSSWSSSVQ